MIEVKDKEFEKIQKALIDFKTEIGKINSTNVWKELEKAYPRKTKPLPLGAKNIHGQVITDPEEKEKVTLQHFQHRTRN